MTGCMWRSAPPFSHFPVQQPDGSWRMQVYERCERHFLHHSGELAPSEWAVPPINRYHQRMREEPWEPPESWRVAFSIQREAADQERALQRVEVRLN